MTWKRITGPLWGNPLVNGGFLSQKANNAELLCFSVDGLNKLLNDKSTINAILNIYMGNLQQISCRVQKQKNNNILSHGFGIIVILEPK